MSGIKNLLQAQTNGTKLITNEMMMKARLGEEAGESAAEEKSENEPKE